MCVCVKQDTSTEFMSTKLLQRNDSLPFQLPFLLIYLFALSTEHIPVCLDSLTDSSIDVYHFIYGIR